MTSEAVYMVRISKCTTQRHINVLVLVIFHVSYYCFVVPMVDGQGLGDDDGQVSGKG